MSVEIESYENLDGTIVAAFERLEFCRPESVTCDCLRPGIAGIRHIVRNRAALLRRKGRRARKDTFQLTLQSLIQRGLARRNRQECGDHQKCYCGASHMRFPSRPVIIDDLLGDRILEEWGG